MDISGNQKSVPVRGALFAGHRRGTVVLFIVLLLLLALLFVFGVVKGILSLLPVGKITVEGLTRYDEEELICFSGIKTVGKRCQIDRKETVERLLAQYPYLKEVSVKNVFPAGICIAVTEEQPLYCISVAGESFVLNGELKVLERIPAYARFSAGEGLLQVSSDGVRAALVGQTLDFDGDYLADLLAQIAESPLSDRIDGIAVQDRYHVTVSCDGLYTLYLGDLHNISAKLNIAALMLKDESLLPGVRATLDVSNPQKTTIRYDRTADTALTTTASSYEE